jgi:hypothetical protein
MEPFTSILSAVGGAVPWSATALSVKLLEYQWSVYRQGSEHDLHWRVEPICDRQSSEINIVVRCRGAVDDDRSEDTVTVLNRVVAVVPRGPILRRLERVHFLSTRWDRTFRDARRSVHIISAQLSDTMPMYTGSVHSEAIGHGDLDGISPLRDDRLHWSVSGA